jgi:hypothetical protein
MVRVDTFEILFRKSTLLRLLGRQEAGGSLFVFAVSPNTVHQSHGICISLMDPGLYQSTSAQLRMIIV